MKRASFFTTRRGVSLIEILVSLGILAVGLVGVIALMTAGSHETNRGVISDRLAQVGRNAHRDFVVRDMGNPLRWAKKGGGSPLPPTSPLLYLCIDPVSIATTFPSGGGTFSIPRITLTNAPNANANTVASLMSPTQASLIFVAHDDLIFGEPPANDLLRPQNFLSGNGTNIRRASADNFSWSAMITRPPDAIGDWYRLSILVYYNRDLTITGNLAPEREVGIIMSGGGVTGGDIQITASDPRNLAVNTGEWMMLAGNAGGSNRVYQWYKIIAADQAVIGGSGSFSRDLTLSGADWNPTAISGTVGVVYSKRGAKLNSDNTFNGNIYQGIVGVYEKTIRLHNTSLWAN